MSLPALTTRMTMSQALARVVEARPQQPAIICDALRLTYAQLQERIDRAAPWLERRGVGAGDRLALYLWPGPDFVALFFAAAQLGAVVVPLDPGSHSGWQRQAIEQTEPRLIVAPSDAPLWDGAGLPPARPRPAVAPTDLLAILYTSGTTGTPKGAMHTHRSLLAPVVASTRLRELWMRRPTLGQLPKMGRALLRYRERLLRAAGRPQVFLSTVGFHTISGLEVFLQALLMGDTLVIQPHFQPAQALELVGRERVTVLIAVPTALAIMLKLRDFDRYDLSSLLICGSGSAPCPPDLARQVQERFGCGMDIGFGATELGGPISATHLGDSDDVQAETVGQPMPGIDVRIVDETGASVGVGQVGEVLARGEGVMAGYWGVPASEAPVDQEGWYHTGDLGVQDARGYLRIVGRKSDLIIRGGRNIHPEDIERALARHPLVQEVVVAGVPRGLGGEEVWAFVVAKDASREAGQEVTTEVTTEVTKEGKQPLERELREFCRDHLEPHQVPQVVRLVSQIPRTSSGKPQRFRLREMALADGDRPTGRSDPAESHP